MKLIQANPRTDNEQSIYSALNAKERLLRHGVTSFSKAGKNKWQHVKFQGFDGNYETEHMGVARFLINDMNRFERFKKRELNSHVPSVQRYGRMFRVFEPIRATLIGTKLAVSQLIVILKAQEEPIRRRV